MAIVMRGATAAAGARAMAGLLAGALLAACAPGAEPAAESRLRFLGEALVEATPSNPGDPPVGGLSSLARTAGDEYYAVSDDRGNFGPARYYVLRIDLGDGRLETRAATVIEWRELMNGAGEPLEPGTFDHEGLVPLNGHLFVASEGDASLGIAPSVAVFGGDGRRLEPLALPPGFAPDPGATRGVRNNQAFESLTVTPDARYLFTATEAPLAQDERPATEASGGVVTSAALGGVVRLLRFDRDHGGFDAQFAYELDAAHAESPQTDGLEVNGLVELLALSEQRLLALERSFVAGAEPPYAINVFEVCLNGATDVSGIDSLAATASALAPARKRLVAAFTELVPRIDNLEGMTFGPTLASGERTLLLISDDNFAPQRQVTQVLAFALSGDALVGCGD